MHSIHIGDSMMPITTNLDSPLVKLRYNDRPRVLWIFPVSIMAFSCLSQAANHLLVGVDGICINHQSNSEEGKQVRRMGTFYKYAEQVMVYLGEASDGSHELLPLIEAISSKVIPLPYGLPLPDVALNILESRRLKIQYGGLMTSILRPWWTRYWVIQEVIKG